MVSHNYDGDMLTDEIAQIHRSPGFITSNLIGKSKSGSMIKVREMKAKSEHRWADPVLFSLQGI